jgi:imidazolonepropionase-like amidohydrolase
VVTPAFIDPHSHIGMYRAGEPMDEGDGNERMDPFLVFSDALDAVQMEDTAFREAVEMGVLYSCVLPGSGNILGGRSAVIRNWAPHTNAALLARAGIKAALGFNPTSNTEWKGDRPSTRMGAMGMLRSRLTELRHKLEAGAHRKGAEFRKPSITAAEGVLRTLLDGSETLRVHVHKTDDLSSLLRLVREFGLKAVVEHAMDVHTPDIFRELRRMRIPVVYGPLDSFAYKVELKHKSWKNIRHLVDSGVTYGLMSDHPVCPARNLLLQTRWFFRHGLNRQQAVELITVRNAEILGLGGILGSLQRGRLASFVCWNGDPFDLTRHPVTIFAEGERIDIPAPGKAGDPS